MPTFPLVKPNFCQFFPNPKHRVSTRKNGHEFSHTFARAHKTREHLSLSLSHSRFLKKELGEVEEEGVEKDVPFGCRYRYRAKEDDVYVDENKNEEDERGSRRGSEEEIFFVQDDDDDADKEDFFLLSFRRREKESVVVGEDENERQEEEDESAAVVVAFVVFVGDGDEREEVDERRCCRCR